MFVLSIGDRQVIFCRFFNPEDTSAAMLLVPEGTQRVVFIDTPAKTPMVNMVKALIRRGVEVIVRDHHDEANPSNERGQQIKARAHRLRGLLDRQSIISDRATHPACSTLIKEGEFAKEGTVIVADMDLDGLTGAMKATGVVYPDLDADAAIFDNRALQSQEKLSNIGWLAIRSLGWVPRFKRKNPRPHHEFLKGFFRRFVLMSQGDAEATEWFQQKAKIHDGRVERAQLLIQQSFQVAPHVWVTDVQRYGAFDHNTLVRALDARGARITVLIKDIGPIASVHEGPQVTLKVSQAWQDRIDLRELVPRGHESSPQAGIISNTTFLLHVSEHKWRGLILSALQYMSVLQVLH